MAKRMILMLLVVGVIVTLLGVFKVHQFQAAMAQAAGWQPPPEAVTTTVATRDRWAATVEGIGTVTAVNGVTVAADLPGIVERIAFTSGSTVRKGDVLVQLDARQERAQLTAAEAQRDLAQLNLDRMRGLREKGVVSQAELDTAEAALVQTAARVGEIQATIERKTIRAPFAGILGIRQVDLGQYLSGGDPVVPLQSLQPIHVDFTVPQQEVGRLRTGTEVTVEVAGGPAATGTLTAVDSIVDEATRNVRVQATLSNADGALRPGMFVQARVAVDAGQPVVTVPASAVSYAPYGDSVFVVEDLPAPTGDGTYLGARQKFVRLGTSRGDRVAVVSGLDEGQQVVTSGAFRLRDGAAVTVNNEVQPSNELAPTPENS